MERHKFFRNLGIIVKTKKVEVENTCRPKPLSRDFKETLLLKNEDESSNQKYCYRQKTDKNQRIKEDEASEKSESSFESRESSGDSDEEEKQDRLMDDEDIYENMMSELEAMSPIP